jgi:hypothetical protein
VRMTKHVIVVLATVAFVGGWAPSAYAAFVSKRDARTYLLGAVPKGAARVMLPDERARFFHPANVWIEPARSCHRRSAEAVSCRIRVRLEPDAAHRAANWWPISCSGAVLVRRLGDGRLKGDQLNYVCRTLRR